MDKIKKSKKRLELVASLFELQNMFTKIPFLVWGFKSGNWKEKEKITKHWISQEQKEVFRGNKNRFS